MNLHEAPYRTLNTLPAYKPCQRALQQVITPQGKPILKAIKALIVKLLNPKP